MDMKDNKDEENYTYEFKHRVHVGVKVGFAAECLKRITELNATFNIDNLDRSGVVVWDGFQQLQEIDDSLVRAMVQIEEGNEPTKTNNLVMKIEVQELYEHIENAEETLKIIKHKIDESIESLFTLKYDMFVAGMSEAIKCLESLTRKVRLTRGDMIALSKLGSMKHEGQGVDAMEKLYEDVMDEDKFKEGDTNAKKYIHRKKKS